MPVAPYDSTRPAAMSEKIACWYTAPLTVRVRNFSTTSPSEEARLLNSTGRRFVGIADPSPVRTTRRYFPFTRLG